MLRSGTWVGGPAGTRTRVARFGVGSFSTKLQAHRPRPQRKTERRRRDSNPHLRPCRGGALPVSPRRLNSGRSGSCRQNRNPARPTLTGHYYLPDISGLSTDGKPSSPSRPSRQTVRKDDPRYQPTDRINSPRSTVRPVAVRLLLDNRPAPTAGAQAPVRPVPLAAALGTPPRREVSTAPRPHVSPQAVTVGRMRRSVSVLCVRLTAPARFAAQTIGPVAGAAAHRTQPRGAVALACSAGSGRQRAPRAVADGWINRGGADRGRRHPASQAHRPGHATVEPTAADHAPFDNRRGRHVRVPVHGHRVPATAVVPFRHGAALDCRCRASVPPAGSPAGTSRTGHARRSSRRRTGYRSRRRGGEPAPRRRGHVAPRRNPRTTCGPAAAETARTAYRDGQPAGPRSAFFRRWDR